MVKVTHVHETSLFLFLFTIVSLSSSLANAVFEPFPWHFRPIAHPTPLRIVILEFRSIYEILACKLVKLSIHHEIKEITTWRIISHSTLKINCPKKWMTFRRSGIRETYQINCNMANNSFFIEHTANRPRNSLHIHIRQRFLREETAAIHSFFYLNFVEGTY